MRIRQRISYNPRQPTERLYLPDNAPYIFGQGTWAIGWTDRLGVADRLCLTWKSVPGTVHCTFFRLAFLTDTANPDLVWSSEMGSGCETGSRIFPLEESGSLSSPRMETPNTVIAQLEVEIADKRASTGLRAGELTGRLAPLLASATPHDVCLSFPRRGRELWTSEAILRQSPYFRTLFSSGFSEAKSTRALPSASSEPSFDDSDDDADASLPPPPPSSSSSATSAALHPPPYKVVPITETSYTTYAAVLVWLYCGHITFAPLISSFCSKEPTRKDDSKGKSHEAVPAPPAPALTSFPTPPSTSPKSVYRLAHLLELDKLAALALSNYRTQLTVSNAAYELFTETSMCYDALGDAVLAFIVRRREAVFESKVMKETAARAEAGELEEWENRVWTKLALAPMESGR
ncbi:hypothetical protein JCM8097_000714 [Rhodosporidiobolus ruineniae]